MKVTLLALFITGLCLLTLTIQLGCDSGDDDDDDNDQDDEPEDDDHQTDDDDTGADDDASDDDTSPTGGDDDTAGDDDDVIDDDDLLDDDDLIDDDDDVVSNWALSFNGVDQYAATAADVTPTLGSNFTVEGWFKLNDSAGANLTLIDYIYAADNPNPPPTYLFEGGCLLTYANAENRFHFCYVNMSGGLPCVQSTEIGNVNQWLHIAATFASGQACLYINGIQNNCGTSMGAYAAHEARLFVGKRKAYMEDPSYYQGLMDEIRISTTVRYTGDFTPATELAADADTVAHFSFEEGAGQTAFDDSGNANHLALSGATYAAH